MTLAMPIYYGLQKKNFGSHQSTTNTIKGPIIVLIKFISLESLSFCVSVNCDQVNEKRKWVRKEAVQWVCMPCLCCFCYYFPTLLMQPPTPLAMQVAGPLTLLLGPKESVLGPVIHWVSFVSQIIYFMNHPIICLITLLLTCRLSSIKIIVYMFVSMKNYTVVIVKICSEKSCRIETFSAGYNQLLCKSKLYTIMLIC